MIWKSIVKIAAENCVIDFTSEKRKPEISLIERLSLWIFFTPERRFFQINLDYYPRIT